MGNPRRLGDSAERGDVEPAAHPVPLSGLEGRQIALVDLPDRVLAGGGVVVTGDVTLSIADIDPVKISLRALVASVRVGMTAPGPSP